MANIFFSEKLFWKYHYFVQIAFSCVVFAVKLKKKIFSLVFALPKTLLIVLLYSPVHKPPPHTGQFTISGGTSGKEQPVNAGDIRDEGSIPG